MAEEQPSIFSRLQGETRTWRSDIGQMAALRWQLAQLELQLAAGQARRLGIAAGVSYSLILVGLGPWITLCAEQLAVWTTWSKLTWLAIFGGVLVAGAVVAGWIAFRAWREFSFLEDSLAEVQEDLRWVRQWTGVTTRAPSGPSSQEPATADRG